MHESYEENEWDAVLEELEGPEDDSWDSEEDEITALTKKLEQEAVFITVGLSLNDGVMVSSDGDNDILMISLLSALFNGDIDDKILDQLPKYKVAFPNWGDETPMIYPDKTLWEHVEQDDQP